jgi:hypothetical protein
MDLYAVAERWPDGIWRVVAVTFFCTDPIEAILIVAGPTADLVAKGAATRGWAAQAATCDRGENDDPSIVRIRMFRSVRTDEASARVRRTIP